MADIRIKDLATTASTTASDDFLAVDGTTNGTRKLSAATPSFATSVTVPSVAGPTATALTLTGGSTGASLVLGQGASGRFALTANSATTGYQHVFQNATAGGGVGVTATAAASEAFLYAGGTGASVFGASSKDAVLWLAAQTSGRTMILAGDGYGSANNIIFGLALNKNSTPTELMRLTTSSNLLIGGTTDIPGSGGLKVFGTTAALNTASGALQVAGGVGVAGAGFFGGTANAARFTVGGGTGSADRMIEATGTHSGTASSLFGVVVNPTVPATTTTAAYGAFIAPETASGSFTLANAYGLYVQPFTPNGSATITNNYAIYATGRVNVAATTSASSSTVGALTIGNGTAATNVAIGGGNVNAGGTLTSGYHSATPPASLGAYNAGIPTSLLKDILVAGDASRRVAIAAYQDSSPYAQWSFTSQGTEFVRMSTNPSSVVPSGVLSVLGTSASTGAGTGALQVAGGIYAGAASVFGSTVTTGGNIALPSGSTLSFGAGLVPGNSYTLYATGALTYLNVNSGGTIRMSDNNSTALLSMSLAGGASFYGAATFGGAVAVAGATVSTSTGIITPAATTAISSVRLPHGTAPTSPVNGDMWTTTAGLYVRINGVTVGPLS